MTKTTTQETEGSAAPVPQPCEHAAVAKGKAEDRVTAELSPEGTPGMGRTRQLVLALLSRAWAWAWANLRAAAAGQRKAGSRFLSAEVQEVLVVLSFPPQHPPDLGQPHPAIELENGEAPGPGNKRTYTMIPLQQAAAHHLRAGVAVAVEVEVEVGTLSLAWT